MADEAGPSGTGTGRLSEEQLAEVEEKFQKGVQAIKVRCLMISSSLGLLHSDPKFKSQSSFLCRITRSMLLSKSLLSS